MVDETVKIFADPGIKVAATCVRVPVYDAHSESVNVETREQLGAAAARELLAAAPGVEVVDDPATAVPHAARRRGQGCGLHGPDPRRRHRAERPQFLVVGDNLRKGAALNAVQIAESWRSAIAPGARGSLAGAAMSDANERRAPRLYDIVVVGAGPGGITAAIYSSRSRFGTWCSSATSPAASCRSPNGSRTTPAFPTASGASSWPRR